MLKTACTRNVLVCKFSMCSIYVKIFLFKAFYTPRYTAIPRYLWHCSRKSSMWRFTVAYNGSIRLLLKAPRSCSTSQMFVNFGVPTCSAVIRNLTYRCMCRLWFLLGSRLKCGNTGILAWSSLIMWSLWNGF